MWYFISANEKQSKSEDCVDSVIEFQVKQVLIEEQVGPQEHLKSFNKYENLITRKVSKIYTVFQI